MACNEDVYPRCCGDITTAGYILLLRCLQCCNDFLTMSNSLSFAFVSDETIIQQRMKCCSEDILEPSDVVLIKRIKEEALKAQEWVEKGVNQATVSYFMKFMDEHFKDVSDFKSPSMQVIREIKNKIEQYKTGEMISCMISSGMKRAHAIHSVMHVDKISHLVTDGSCEYCEHQKKKVRWDSVVFPTAPGAPVKKEKYRRVAHIHSVPKLVFEDKTDDGNFTVTSTLAIRVDDDDDDDDVSEHKSDAKKLLKN